MTYQEAVKEFRYLAEELYVKQVDYWTAQLAWAGYVDSLCKEGRITERQYMTWETPFKYGKRLKMRKVYSM